MSDLDLNWDDVLGEVEEDEKENPAKPQGDFEALPKGPYEVVVQEAEKLVSSSGNDMIKVRVQVSSGPFANRVLFSYIVFAKTNPKAMRMTLERLAAFGITREFIALQKPSIAEIAELLVGLKATAVVAIQDSGEYKGRNEIKSFRALEGAPQPTPQVAASKPAGVPNIPAPEAPAPAASAPSIPVPDVPVGVGSAEDPFEG
jgi:hypothetical protein